MKHYYSLQSTPLKFHKIFYNVISPILIAVQVLILVATIGHLIDYDGYYNFVTLVLNLFSCCLAIIFLSFITYGFFKKRKFAWYMVYAYLILTILSNVVSAIQLDNIAFAVGQIIGALIIPTLIGIYYYKRKSLFFLLSDENVVQARYLPRHPDDTLCKNDKTSINYCRKCGTQVITHGVFCNKCGTKTDWNRKDDKNDKL